MRKSLSTLFRSRFLKSFLLLSFSSLILLSCGSDSNGGQSQPFELLEATIADIHDAYRSGQLTSRQLVQLYMNRIEAYDKNGPTINSIITVNPKALEEADQLDTAFQSSGLVGPLHGIPIILKDQIDSRDMPTTLARLS